MTPRLRVSLHAVSVRRGDRWALRDLSMELRAGERWALVGGNGAGKTQLLKLIGTDVWPTPTGRETRTYRLGRRRGGAGDFDGKDGPAARLGADGDFMAQQQPEALHD